MTTQLQVVALSGPSMARRFSKTQTDTTEAEITSTTSSLSLYKVFPLGTMITHAAGQFAAGIGWAYIYNQKTKEIKAYIICDVIGEEIYRPLDYPVIVEDGDIIQGYVDVAGT